MELMARTKGLLYMDAKVNGSSVRAMIDSGTSHNFVSVDEAQRLGLKMVDEGGIYQGSKLSCTTCLRCQNHIWNVARAPRLIGGADG